MAKKFTASDIEKLQKNNEQNVKNQVIPSLQKMSGGDFASGKVSSYQPSNVTQQRTIIDTTKPVVKTSTPQVTKTTSNTMTIGGKTFNVSANANSNSTLTSANGKNVVIPERQIKNNTREYAYGQKNKLGSLLAKTGYGLGASVEGVGALAKGLTGKEVTDRDLRATRARENYMAGATSDMGKSGNLVYGLGSSAADMGMDALLTMGNTWAMPTLSGFRTAADTINNAKERGISDRQAAVSGLISGGIDFAMNKVGLNKLEDALAKEGSSRLRNVGAGMVAEGGEEALQNILDEVADNIVNGKQSNDYLEYTSYKNSGMSDKDAIIAVAKNRFLETLQAAGGGALFGGVFGGLNSNVPQLEQNIGPQSDAQTNNSNWLSDAEIESLLNEAEMSRNADLENANNNILNNVENNTNELSTTPISDANIPDSALELLQQNIENTITNNDVNNVPMLENNTEITPEDVKSIEREIAAIDEQLYSLGESGNDAKYNELMARKKELYNQLPTPTNAKFENTNKLFELLDLQKNESSENASIPSVDEYQSMAQDNNQTVDEMTSELDAMLDDNGYESVRTRQLAQTLNEIDERLLHGNVTDESQFNRLQAARRNILNELRKSQAADESLDIDAEIAAGRMGYDAEGNLEAYENVGLNDLPELPKADEPYVSVIDMLEGKNELNNIPDSASVQFDDEITNNNVNSKKRLSNVATNTAVNNDFYSQSDIKNNPTIRAVAEYDVEGEQESMDEAIDRVINDGYKWEQDYVSGKAKINTNKDVDTAMCLLTELNHQIDVARYGNDKQTLSALEARKLALFSKAREAGTEGGRMIQAFAKWNRTADGAILNADTIIENSGKKWAKKNSRKAKQNSQLAKALADMGYKDAYKSKQVTPKTHEQLRQEVVNTLAKEYGSVEQYFKDSDVDVITSFIENGIETWQLTDEITHFLENGDWYTLDESIPPSTKGNPKLESAFRQLVEEGKNSAKEKATFDEIREQVKNSFDNEYASVANQMDITDQDIDFLANMIDQGAKVDELADAMNRKMASGTFGISSETQEQVNYLFNRAKNANPESKERVKLETEAYRILAEELVGTGGFIDKFNAWRYLAMLGNPKTHERNMIGNIIFQGMTGVSNNLAAAMEATLDATSKTLRNGQGIERTKAILNPLNSADREMFNLSKADADGYNYRTLAGQKYNDGVKSQIEQQINPFKSKIMRKYYDANGKALEAEDYLFVKMKYATSMAGYLKANGADASIFNDANNELLVKAREYATKQAEYAAFHEDNKLATLLSRTSSQLRNVDSDSAFENFASHTASNMIEGLVPFKKTPMNVLRSGVEYSPLNTVQDLNKLYKVLRGKDSVKAADYLESVSKTLTGTAIFALGAALYDKGILRTQDEETQYQDQLEGKQNYSIKIGNKTYTIDNFAPFVMPLFAGAETKKAWDNRNGSVEKFWNLITSGNFDADALLNATGEIANGAASVANGITNPIVETSMLQGVQNTMEDVGRAVQENDSLGVLGTLVTNPLISYGTQVLPTLSGQLARTVDDTRRSTYTDKTGFAGSLERQGRKAMNKIPGLSKFNEPYVDTYGRTEKNSPYNNLIANAAYQFLSPSYVDDLNSTRADRSARNLYEKTGDATVFADKKTSKKIDIKDANGKVIGNRKLTPEEYTKYSQVSGSVNKDIREKVATNKNFNSLDMDQQKEILAKIDTLADKVGESKVNRTFKSDDDVYEAYQNGKELGVANYLIDKALLNQGASVYKDKNGKPKSFSSCSLQEQSEIVNKLVSQNKMTKSQAAKYMKDTDKFIVMDGNTSQTLQDKYGQQGADLYYDLTQNALNEKGSMTTQSVLPYLQSKGVSQDMAGDVLYSLSNSDKVDEIYNEQGTQGIYQYYNIKYNADSDGNGSLKKDELTSYLDSLNLTQDQKRYWFSKMSTSKKNPY